jgi:TonB family protein
MLDLEELIDLIEELRLAGYNIGAQQYSAAQNLLLALATRGRLPAEPHGLVTLLAPILCSAPKEQENFYRHFADWLARHPHLTRSGPQPAQPEATKHAAEQSAPPTFMRRLQAMTARLRQRPKAFMAGVAAIILLLTSAVLLRSMPQTLPDISAPEQPLNGHVLGEQGEAVQGARVDFAGQTATSGTRGEFSLTYKPEQATAQLAVSHPDYEANSVTYDQAAALLNHTAPRLIQLRQRTSAPPLPSPAPVDHPVFTPTPPPTPTPTPPPTAYEKYYSWLRAAAVGLPLLMFLGWWLARWYRRRMLLQKLPSARRPLLERIVVRGAAERLYQGQTFRRTVQELRRHRQRGARELDAHVTVQATARKGGLFTPFYGARKTLPEYLILLDRASLRDQQARLEEELIKRLTEENVFVDLYYFQGEPRLCRKQEQGAPYLTLPDLAALHPEHHLLIFSDGASFINQFTGAPERWLEQFGPWPRRALLTPESPADWHYREWLLAELDFIVLPADRVGLAALGEAINTGAPPKLDGRASPYPELLRERPRRWLERHAPRPVVAARLDEELRRFLGAEGYYWLCACAVYPALHWNLTLYFGQRLLANRDEIETQLLALVRLPWFRYGQMPDWLRLRLISALTPQQEQSVRRALEELLTSALEHPTAGLPLDIAPPTAASEPHGLRKFLHALAERLRRWRQQRNLRTLLRAEPPPSPLRDYVFLSFMSRRTHRLSVNVPETLRRLLYPQGQPVLGLRPASALTLAALLSLVGFAALTKFQSQQNPVVVTPSGPTPVPPTTPTPIKLYTQMSPTAQQDFVAQQTQRISQMLGAGAPMQGVPTEGQRAIKQYVDAYAARVNNNSTQPLAEDLRYVYARATQSAPIITQAFKERDVPPVMGLYIAMICSEYQACTATPPSGRGLFNLVAATMKKYGADPTERCDAVKSAAVAAAYLKDSRNEFGRNASSTPLVLLSFSIGTNTVRKYLDDIANVSTTPDFWTLYVNRDLLDQVFQQNASNYVPRFFAAAIIGENPQVFGLPTQPLSSYTEATTTPSPTMSPAPDANANQLATANSNTILPPISNVTDGSGTIVIDFSLTGNIPAGYQMKLELSQIKIERVPNTQTITAQTIGRLMRTVPVTQSATFANLPAGFQYQLRAGRASGDWMLQGISLDKDQVKHLTVKVNASRPRVTSSSNANVREPILTIPGTPFGVPANANSGMGEGTGRSQPGGNINSGRDNSNSNQSSAPLDPNRIYSIKEVTQKPVILFKPEPAYTEEARRNSTQGVVVLRVVLKADGTVSGIKPITSLPDGLTERAMLAARQIKFKPAMKDGRPVSIAQTLEYNFNLY